MYYDVLRGNSATLWNDVFATAISESILTTGAVLQE
jgi:hypothetical protein